MRVTGGTLRIALPWNPDRSLRTAAQRDSALEAERAKPGRVIEEGGDGLRRVILLSDLDARFARLRIATPDRKPFTVDIDSLATRVNDPAVTVRDAVGPGPAPRRQRHLQPLAAARCPTPGSPAAARSPGRTTPSCTTSR